MVIDVDLSKRVLEAPSAIGGAAQDASRTACAVLEKEAPAGEFPRIDDASVETPLVEQPMCHHQGSEGPVSLLMVPEGPLRRWRLVHMLSQWSRLGLGRMHWLLTKKLPRHSLTTGGPLTRGTLLSRTFANLTLITFAYWRWLTGRTTPSSSLST